jgi:hypothetical protein
MMEVSENIDYELKVENNEVVVIPLIKKKTRKKTNN